MSETKDEKPLDGLTGEVRDGMPSLPVMRDGEEPPDTLLALFNNALVSMINSQQAKILGTGKIDGRVGTLIMVYDVQPTADNLLALVGKENE